MSESSNKTIKKLALETDQRFPSGPWTGFWIQRGWGKEKMWLSLAFAKGRVSGSGRDIIGRFDFTGTYDLKSGRVRLVKQYEKAHRVRYDGANQGDGLWLWGVWTVFSQRGGFHLWPEGEDDPTQKHLKESQELPTDANARRLKIGELLPL